MVERSIRIRQVGGSMPPISKNNVRQVAGSMPALSTPGGLAQVVERPICILFLLMTL